MRHSSVPAQALLLALVAMAGLALTNEASGEVQGIFDGYSYTAPLGLFSVFVRDSTEVSSFKDEVKNLGEEANLSYRDKANVAYVVSAGKAKPDLSPTFLEDMVAKAKETKNTQAQLEKTPDGRDCFISRELTGDQPDAYVFKWRAVFYKNFTIFSLQVETPMCKTKEEAAKLGEMAVGNLWQDIYFRGRFDDQLSFTIGDDPRIPAILSAAKRAAAASGYRFGLEFGKKPILHLQSQGKDGKISLNIRIKTNGKNIETTEAVSCLATDKPEGVKMMAHFFKLLDRYMIEEKVRIKRSLEYDPELLTSPARR